MINKFSETLSTHSILASLACICKRSPCELTIHFKRCRFIKNYQISLLIKWLLACRLNIWKKKQFIENENDWKPLSTVLERNTLPWKIFILTWDFKLSNYSKFKIKSSILFIFIKILINSFISTSTLSFYSKHKYPAN